MIDRIIGALLLAGIVAAVAHDGVILACIKLLAAIPLAVIAWIAILAMFGKSSGEK